MSLQTAHPFRFGVTASWAASGQAWTDLARRAEALGYDILLMPDHLGRQLAPGSALAAAAAVTQRLRIGSFVYANDYRHPLILAREAATLDHLSNGRVEFGIGAGWKTSDYRQLGMAYDRPGERIDRMLEAVRLMKGLFSGERVSQAGPHYRLEGAQLAPRPIQRPIPILIGGGGPRMLRIAAQEADIVGLLTQFDTRGRPIFTQATEAQTASKVAVVREAAGSRETFERLELNVLVQDAGLVGSGTSPMGSVMSVVKSAAPSLVGGSPYLLYGTLSQVRETLLRRREQLGISYYVWRARHMEPMGPLVEELAGR
jgi:probable F420-dependent oxidoreductase